MNRAIIAPVAWRTALLFAPAVGTWVGLTLLIINAAAKAGTELELHVANMATGGGVMMAAMVYISIAFLIAVKIQDEHLMNACRIGIILIIATMLAMIPNHMLPL